MLARRPRGARLRQVGAAQVLPGLNFRASMLVDVAEHGAGVPARSLGVAVGDAADDDSPAKRARRESASLVRDRFPAPFTVAERPYRDITMQSVAGGKGDFTLYQGLWRIQDNPGCAPAGGRATRLSYAVEIQPRPWLPVALVESRIAADLVTNLDAVNAAATKREAAERAAAARRLANSPTRAAFSFEPSSTLELAIFDDGVYPC